MPKGLAPTIKCLLVTFSTCFFTLHQIDGDPQFHLNPPSEDSSATEITWSFTVSFDGWADSTSDKMQTEVSLQSQSLYGIIIGKSPFIDSPLMSVPSYGKHYFVLRLTYSGECTSAKIILTPDEAISFDAANDSFIEYYFTIIPDGNFHIYYIPIWKKFYGIIKKLRFFPGISLDNSPSPKHGNTFALDWISIVKAPTIYKVRGCIDVYSSTIDFLNPMMNMTTNIEKQGFLSVLSTTFSPLNLTYARTYNCLRSGGNLLTIDGINFGNLDVLVFINGKKCLNVVITIPEYQFQCISPSATSSLETRSEEVIVRNGQLHGLYDKVSSFSYAVSIPYHQVPSISNIASHSIDLNWNSSNNLFQAVTITGYKIKWKTLNENEYKYSCLVGNVTTTTIFDLIPDTGYQFSIAAIVEPNDNNIGNHFKVYPYGRRRKLTKNAIIGKFSNASNVIYTLKQDILFTVFNAKSTLNISTVNQLSTLGPTGNIGGEGHYGLYVVGDANIENCNSSYVCCDEYNPLSNNSNQIGCSSISSKGSSINKKKTLTNAFGYINYGTITITNVSLLDFKPTLACGPALRLTSSDPKQSGAAWYPRQMDVKHGFNTTFQFRISSPSLQCVIMDDIYTNCRSRGGDGLAFVIQGKSEIALGEEGKGLSYEGIKNSIAIEFDTWYNYELQDPYENHISIQTRGAQVKNSANHNFSLGSTVRVPDLTDGIHTVRIVYNPKLQESIIFSGVFHSTTYTTKFIENYNKHLYNGLEEYGQGLGSLAVYLDDLLYPVLAIPLNIEAVLNLKYGRAWVGFTASTGAIAWQVHDILNWNFSSTMMEFEKYKQEPLINSGISDEKLDCSNTKQCSFT